MNGNADMSTVRLLNCRKIWDCVHTSGHVTIPQISRDTGLSIPTVTRAVEYSITEGLLKSTGLECDGARGRNAASYEINPDYAHVLFCSIQAEIIYYEIHDFKSCVLRKGQIQTSDSDILKDIDTLIKKSLCDFPKIKIIGLAVSGTVFNGKITESYNFPSLNGFALREIIAEKYGKFVFIENDMRAAVSAAEKYDRSYKNGVTAAFLFGSGGYGCAVSVKGRLFKGANGSAGSLRNVTVTGSERRSNTTYADFLRSVISLFDPSQVIMYPNFDTDSETVISIAMNGFISINKPRFIAGRNFSDDIFLGLSVICKKKLLRRDGKTILLQTSF